MSAKAPSSRVEVLDYAPNLSASCSPTRAQVPALRSSGRVAVRLYGKTRSGRSCDGWAWLKYRLFAEVLVTHRAVHDGDPLAVAVRAEEREILAGRSPLTTLPSGAVASRSLPAGMALERAHTRVGLKAGSSITVVLQSGSFLVEQPGRLVACAGDQACAVLPNGKRVQGVLENDRLFMESR